MTAQAEKPLIKLDSGSAHVLSNVVEEGVGCHQSIGLKAEEGLFPELRHGLFCKTFMSRSEVGDPVSNDQCVVMSEDGQVHKCPVFGQNEAGETLGLHEKVRILADLNRKIKANLVHSEVGNFSTIWKSELDPSNK